MQQPQALLCDRDGTLIQDEHFLADPQRIRWIPGVLEQLPTAHRRGIKVLMITNQSGVARGYFGVETVEAINARLVQDVSAVGGAIAGTYYCPHHPQGQVPEYSLDCHCRKPQPGLFQQAIQDHQLHPPACWVVGDRLRDLEPGLSLGMRAFLVQTGYGSQAEAELVHQPYAPQVTVVPSLATLLAGL